MNLYLVVSEELKETLWEDWFNQVGHQEVYCIAELVVASKPSQAKWLAWKTDRASFNGNPRDMPKFSCRRIRDVGHISTAQIVSAEQDFQDDWSWEPQPPLAVLSGSQPSTNRTPA